VATNAPRGASINHKTLFTSHMRPQPKEFAQNFGRNIAGMQKNV
jgi:hypothetical protein